MKCHIAILIFLFAGAGIPSAIPDQLHLRNGSSLTGEVVSARGPQLVFQPRWSQTRAEIQLRDLDALLLSGDPPSHDLSRSHRLLLVNGDVLSGRLLSLDDHALRWRTLWGDEWTVVRSHVREIHFPPPEEDVFVSGTFPLGDWEITPLRQPDHEVFYIAEGDAITLRPQAMAMLTREFPRLPERLVLEFTVRNDSETFSYNMSLFTDPGNMRAPGAFLVQSNQRNISLQVLSSGRGHHGHWRESLPPGSEHKRRYRFFVDWEKNRARMDVNGAPLREFDLPSELTQANARRALTFRFTQQSSHIRVEGLRLYAWKGGTEAWDAAETERHDVLALWGRKPLTGRILEIQDGRVRFETRDGEIIQNPLHRIQTLRTRRQGRAAPRGRPSDVLLGFAGSADRIALSGFALESETLTGTGTGWRGKISVPHDEARVVWFNAHDVPANGEPLSIDLENSFLQLPMRGGAR